VYLYRLLTERLPNGAIVSVTHRKSLAKFHQETLDIARAREQTVA
jgi:putative ATP-binding cassette transporter